jgi:hypothetical protein
MRELNDSDWTLLKRLKSVALDRCCRRSLEQISATCGSGGASHGRFLRIFSQVQKANDAISRAFDDLRRSTAVMRLASMRQQGLITDEEFSAFSEQTRSSVDTLQEAMGRSRK